MDLASKLHISVAGLSFGAEFSPIYKDHPDVENVAICDIYSPPFQKNADRFNIQRRYNSLDEILKDSDIDAIHPVSAIPDHAT
ncbi:MAG: Gfo/Idh/MocA family oxidoreductase [Anaerolineales bacterium]